MNATSLLAFAGLCALLSLTPGPDVLLVIRYSTRHRRPGVAVGLGSAAGSFGWALLVAVGLAALVEQSAVAYRAVRLLGGCYLIYLGIKTVIQARYGVRLQAPGETTTRPTRPWEPFAAGLLSCLLNPKVGLFFLAVVPQFVPAGAPVLEVVLALAAIDAAVALVFFVAVACITATVVQTLKRPRLIRWIERVSGATLIGLGLGTAGQAAAAKT